MIKWIFNLIYRFRPYQTEWVEDLPSKPVRDTVYIIGGRKHPLYAAIVCPRRACGRVIHLDVSPQVAKRWRIEEHNGGEISLFPSIHVTGHPCCCHYWFRQGRVQWCDTPPVFIHRVNKRDPKSSSNQY